LTPSPAPRSTVSITAPTLCSARFFHLVTREQRFYDRGFEALSRFTSIPLALRCGSDDFSNFPLLLVALCIRASPNTAELAAP